jgi:hypothetical protein
MFNNKDKKKLLNSQESIQSAQISKLETNYIDNNNLKKLSLKSPDNNSNNNDNNDIDMSKKNKGQAKNVMISENVHVIQVESWKKYNIQQNMEPNMDLLNYENSDENEDNKKKRNTNDDVKCHCLVI